MFAFLKSWLTGNAVSSRLFKRRAKWLTEAVRDCRTSLGILHEAFAKDLDHHERRFADIDRWFGEVTRGAQSLGTDAQQRYDSLATVFGDEFQHNLRSCIEELNSSAEKERVKVAADLQLLSDISTCLHDVIENCGTTSRNSDVLRICAIGLSIEGLVSLDSRDVLASFPTQVDDVAKRIGSGLLAMQEDAEQIRSALREQCSQLRDRFNATGQLGGNQASQQKLPERVSRLLCDVAKVINHGQTRAQRIQRLADQGTSHSQTGEFTQKECNRILAALGEIREQFDVQSSGKAKIPELSQDLQLQSAQLQSLCHKVASTMGELDGITNQLATGLSETDGDSNSGVRALFDSVFEDLNRLTQRVTFSRNTARSIRESARHVGEVMQTMAQHRQNIRSINEELRLLATNATVKATRLGGQGRVIAAWTDEIYRLQQVTDNVLAWLDGPFEEMEQKMNSLIDAEGQPDEADEGDSLIAGLPELKQVARELNYASTESDNRARHLRAKMDVRERHLGFLRQLQETLTLRQAALSSVSGHIAGLVTPAAKNGTEDLPPTSPQLMSPGRGIDPETRPSQSHRPSARREPVAELAVGKSGGEKGDNVVLF